jgi:uncharacterized protein with HEPN domain
MIFIRHMLMCLERIKEYTTTGKSGFMAEAKTQDAVIRNLEIIGQCARDYGTEQLFEVAPGLPWHRVAGLRNVLAHEYLGVDLGLVWNIVEYELPALESELRRLTGAPDA